MALGRLGGLVGGKASTPKKTRAVRLNAKKARLARLGTKQQIIAAIRQQHLQANIAEYEQDPAVTIHWDQASVVPGWSIFGTGPYLHVPVSLADGDRVVIRVYPPERLRKTLAIAARED